MNVRWIPEAPAARPAWCWPPPAPGPAAATAAPWPAATWAALQECTTFMSFDEGRQIEPAVGAPLIRIIFDQPDAAEVHANPAE